MGQVHHLRPAVTQKTLIKGAHNKIIRIITL